MICPKCGSGNVNIQAVTNTQLKKKHHGIIWWLLIGWWWLPIWWLLFTIPALIVKILAPKRQKLKVKHSTMAICQQCGHSWKA